MPILFKPASQWRTESVPWFKHPTRNVWEKPVRVYRKVEWPGPENGSDYWVEVWPLVAGAASNPALAQVYRNDRIEWDFSWTAPVDGTPTSYYIVSVLIGGVVYGNYNVAGAFTLTNGGNGFQNVAGQAVQFTVTPYTAAGRPGPVTISSVSTAAQLPPPPVPTAFGISMADGNLYCTWNEVSGRRISGVEMVVNAPGVASGVYNFGPGTVSTTQAQQPWNPQAPTSGFGFTVSVTAYGPGGRSATLQLSGTVPTDPLIWSCRFNSGLLAYRVTVNPATSTALEQYWRSMASGWNLIGTTNVVFTNIDGNVAASPAWARDAAQYQIAVRARCIVGGNLSTGRTIYSGLVRKMPNPYYVSPIDSNTWINGGWRSDSQFIFQGIQGPGLGMNYGFVWYGNKFRDELSDGFVGYHLNPTQADVSLARGSFGTSGPTHLIMWLHRGASIADGFVGLVDGGQWMPDMMPEQQSWGNFPAHWARYLIDQANAWKGIGYQSPDPAVDPTFGGTYSFFASHKQQFIINGVPAHTIRIYHDG